MAVQSKVSRAEQHSQCMSIGQCTCLRMLRPNSDRRISNVQHKPLDFNINTELECALCGNAVHADSKDKVALGDDITLWANRCKKCHGNAISRFHLSLGSAVCKWGVNLSQRIIFSDIRRIPAYLLFRK